MTQAHTSPISQPSVEPFRGTTAELQRFIFDTWNAAYQKRMSFPIWSTEYLDWQLPHRERRLAAYDGDELLGVLLGSPYQFRTLQETFSGSQWSWLSVLPHCKGRNIAKQLDAKRVEIEKNLKSELIVSYRFTGSRHSLAERPHQNSTFKKFHQKLAF